MRALSGGAWQERETVVTMKLTRAGADSVKIDDYSLYALQTVSQQQASDLLIALRQHGAWSAGLNLRDQTGRLKSRTPLQGPVATLRFACRARHAIV